jgi:hypothetical protein
LGWTALRTPTAQRLPRQTAQWQVKQDIDF